MVLVGELRRSRISTPYEQAAEGHLRPTPLPGRPREIGPAEEAAHLDATLAEHCRGWAKRWHGAPGDEGTGAATRGLAAASMWLIASARLGGGLARWCEETKDLDAATLMCADECGRARCAGPDPSAGVGDGAGQPAPPHGRDGAPAHRGARVRAVIPARLLARPLANRAGLRQAQGGAAPRGGTGARGVGGRARPGLGSRHRS